MGQRLARRASCLMAITFEFAVIPSPLERTPKGRLWFYGGPATPVKDLRSL